MPSRYIAHSLFQKVLVFSLSASAFFLPIGEFPKLLFLLIFLCCSLYVQLREKIWQQYDIFDYLLLFWACSGFISASFSPFEYKEWSGAVGNLFIPLSLLFIKYTVFSEKNFLLLLTSILSGTLFATLEGFWQLTSQHETTLMLHSVGFVNQSAIYLCMSFAIALPFCLTRTQPFKFYFALFFLLFLIFSTLYTDSRGSAITLAIIGISGSLIWRKKSRKPFLITIMTLVFLTSSLFYLKTPIIKKTLQQTSKNQLIPERQKIWNSSLLIWRHNPFFGIGIKNYEKADKTIQRQWLAKEKRKYSAKFMPYVHAHSLYFSTLAEQGILGAVIIFLVLLKIALHLKSHFPKPESSQLYWILWLSTLGCSQVVIINGLVNTTLRIEHGLLFAIMAGLWLSFNKHKGSSSHSLTE